MGGKHGECSFTDVRVSREEAFVAFSKYSLTAFALWVEDTAVEKVTKVHDLRGKQTFN